MGLFGKSKKDSRQQPIQHSSKNLQNTQYPKCNCDGCPKQETCQYGHIITDWYDGSRLTLVDKFIRICDNLEYEPSESVNIATLEQRHDLRKLRVLSKERLQATLEHLEIERQIYCEIGKCGIAHYRYLGMQGELQLVKQALKEYDSYHKNLEKLSLVHPYILKELEKHEFILQRDVYKKFDMVEKTKVSKVITRMVEKELIEKIKYSSTYKLVPGKRYIIK